MSWLNYSSKQYLGTVSFNGIILTDDWHLVAYAAIVPFKIRDLHASVVPIVALLHQAGRRARVVLLDIAV